MRVVEPARDAPPGIILAGGQSRRMGDGDKFLRSLRGQPILRWVIDAVRPQTSALVLNANGDLTRLTSFGLPIMADDPPGQLGPLAGIATGLRWAAARDDYLAVFAADTPFPPDDLVHRLATALQAEDAQIAVPVSLGRQHGVFGLWRTSLRNELERAVIEDGCRKVGHFLAAHRVALVPFEAEPFDPFFNINRREDLLHAEDLAAHFQSS
ncbi:molybdenum cofactor guanylyltransferase [Arboricoccus pini]|uniref:Molybdenum cofactor guanylyltransferase n=1 Tax=Arboricoccus pini TaxID=1963835 RepID=A0A212QZ40_9PROT|nr:molybdenum cofactor guanylyltransferase MobA [Arboricoccus pini]SNB64985.1 molybdenum cofactor guanylyltransferase [Arboricoccus pini]